MNKSVWGRVVVTFMLFVSVLLHGEYKDVPQSHWAYEAVEKLTNVGIFSGFPDGTFRGNETVTRFQVAMLLYRLYSLFDSSLREIDSKVSSIQARFFDIPQQSQISDIKQSVEIKLKSIPQSKKRNLYRRHSLLVRLRNLLDTVRKILADWRKAYRGYVQG